MLRICWVFMFNIYFFVSINDLIFNIYYFSILTNIWILDETIIENDDSCEKGEEKICICDRENLFYGRDPLACQMMADQGLISRIKRPGNELTNSGNNLLHVFSALDEVILTCLHSV